MSVWSLDNFTLGLGGLVDLASRADDKFFDLVGVAPDSALRAGGALLSPLGALPNTHVAAKVYTVQATVNATEAEKAATYEKAKRMTDAGALELAASKTVEQVIDGAGGTLKTVLVVAAVAAGAVLAFKVGKMVLA